MDLRIWIKVQKSIEIETLTEKTVLLEMFQEADGEKQINLT